MNINIEVLKNSPNVKKVEKQTVITKEGDNSRHVMFVLLRGSIGVYKQFGKEDQEQISTLKQGDFFGEMTLFSNKAYPTTTVALDHVILLAVTPSSVLDFIKTQPEGTCDLIKVLSRQLYGFDEPKAESPQPAVKEEKKTETPDIEQKPVKEMAPPKTSLFPQGHKSYDLPLEKSDETYFFEKKYTCPVCKKEVTSLSIRRSKLRTTKVDYDLRVHYKGIETIYYDIVTCPHCWYSALADNFENASLKKTDALMDKIQSIKSELPVNMDGEKSMLNIFTGYYLALLTASVCVYPNEIMIAKIWLRLSWIYNNCQDEQMEEYAIEKARNAYVNIYEKTNIEGEQLQQLFLVVGELNYKLGDIDKAKNYFYKVKTSKDAAKPLKEQAEIRLEDCKAAPSTQS